MAQQASDAKSWAGLVREHGLPREALPTEALNSPEVWAALLEGGMPTHALVRNLATMTRVGLLSPTSAATRDACAQLADGERLREARLHPVQVLAALCTYAAGRGQRGQHTWAPVPSIVDALDAAFYEAFGAVEPTGARTLLALDISPSKEQQYECVAFAGAGGYGARSGLQSFPLSSRQRLDDVVLA